MNTSNKTLLQILVEELPNMGGWPEGVAAITQDSDRAINNYKTADGLETNEYGTWRYSSAWQNYLLLDCDVHFLACDYATAIITRDQYEAALAAKNDGWIDWAGGECPVEEGTLVDVRYRCGRENHHVSAGIVCDMGGSDSDWCAEDWSHDNSTHDIIAYRLHQPQEAVQAKADDEADLNECIGQVQSNDQARDEILYELANFAASTCTSLDIGAATQIAIWLSDKGYRKQ